MSTPGLQPSRCAFWTALTLAAGLPLLFMGQTLIGGRPLVRDDAALFVYPMYKALGDCLRQDHLYLWDPAQYAGLPALACGQTGQLYPLHLLFFRLLPWMTALHLGYWLHLALAMMACLWVARNLGLGWKTAALSALLFTFNGYQAAHLVHYNFITATAHVPLLLAVLQTAWRTRSYRWWALLALEAALAFLCSHPQIFLMALTVSGLWLVTKAFTFFSSLRHKRLQGHSREIRALDGQLSPCKPETGDASQSCIPLYRPLVGLLSAIIIALLLVMPQLLPTLELARESRGITAVESVGAEKFMTSYPFRSLDLVRVVLPDLFGTAEANVIGGGPAFHETCAFIGGGALLLVLLGLWIAWSRPGYGFIITLIVAGGALMWAENPIHRLVAHLPLLGSFRAMGRWAIVPLLGSSLVLGLVLEQFPRLTLQGMHYVRKAILWFLLLFFLALLALWLTFGTEGGRLAWPGNTQALVPVENMAAAIHNSLTGWEPLLLTVSLLVVAAVLLTWRSGIPLSFSRAALLGLALIIPLFNFWQITNRTVPRDYYLGEAPPTAQAITNAGEGRLVHLPPELVTKDDTWRMRPATGPVGELARELLTPATGTLFGLRYADGYKQGLVTPSTLRWWDTVYRYAIQTFTGQSETSAETMERVGTPAERMKRFHSLGGVQYIVTPGASTTNDLKLIWDGPVRVYRYRQQHPRLWLVSQVETIPDPTAQLEAVKLRDFDPRQKTVVDSPVSELVDQPIPGVARIESESNLTLKIITNSSSPAVLVLADAWYPGWTVTVDASPHRLLRANAFYRAVTVPAGEHRIEFRFRPCTFIIGLWLALMGVILLGVLCLWPGLERLSHDS